MEKEKKLLEFHGITSEIRIQLLNLSTTPANKLPEKLNLKLKPNHKITSAAPQVVQKYENKLFGRSIVKVSKFKSDNELLLLHGITSRIRINILRKEVTEFLRITKFYGNVSNSTCQNLVRAKRKVHTCPINTCHVKLSPGYLKNHLLANHKSKKLLKCPFSKCHFSTWVLHFLNTHLARVHHQLPFHCSLCPKKWAHNSALRVHMLSHSAPDSKKYICPRPNCEYACHYEQSLKTHLRSHVQELKYNCLHCNWKTKHERSLAAHVKNIHENENKLKLFKCPQCNFTADKLFKINSHSSRIHSDSKPFKCHLCKFSTKYGNSFKDHLIVHSGLKKFKCHLCGKKIRTSQNLQDHVRRHLGEKPFKCPEFKSCSFVAATKSEIKLHVNRHHLKNDETKIKIFQCPLCTKAFYERNLLTAHVHTHTLEKPFSCFFCFREFRANNSRKTHENCCRKRPGGIIRSYKCEYCEMRFSRMGHKSLHEMTCKFRPDGKVIQPFECSVDGCYFAATQKSNLKSHCIRFHQ